MIACRVALLVSAGGQTHAQLQYRSATGPKAYRTEIFMMLMGDPKHDPLIVFSRTVLLQCAVTRVDVRSVISQRVSNILDARNVILRTDLDMFDVISILTGLFLT